MFEDDKLDTASSLILGEIFTKLSQFQLLKMMIKKTAPYTHNINSEKINEIIQKINADINDVKDEFEEMKMELKSVFNLDCDKLQSILSEIKLQNTS